MQLTARYAASVDALAKSNASSGARGGRPETFQSRPYLLGSSASPARPRGLLRAGRDSDAGLGFFRHKRAIRLLDDGLLPWWRGAMGTKWQDGSKADVLWAIAGSVALWLFWRIPLVGFAIYFFSTMPGFDTPLTANNIIAIVLGFGAITLFCRSFGSDHRRPVLKPAKLKKKFIEALLYSKPIVPKHEAPENLVGSLVFDNDRQFFDDFRDFGEVVNLWLADEYSHSRRWRLQELSDTELRHHYSDMLSYGRRFSIFHNQVCVGDLEISAGPRYSPETPNVHLDIKLRWVRVLGFENVVGFLREIAGYTQADFRESRWAIDHAVLGVLCETQEIWDDDDFEPGYGDLELCLSGERGRYHYFREAQLKKKAAERDPLFQFS
jgi:hypothetical protein